eukprot:SAG31_NODE_395_length_16265_cov_4.941420_5_plen_73_part_00
MHDARVKFLASYEVAVRKLVSHDPELTTKKALGESITSIDGLERRTTSSRRLGKVRVRINTHTMNNNPKCVC